MVAAWNRAVGGNNVGGKKFLFFAIQEGGKMGANQTVIQP
jgi:hypothetical protein